MGQPFLLLTTAETRRLLAEGRVTIRRLTRHASGRPAAKPPAAGREYAVREPFASRREVDRVRIRYAADPGTAEPREVPMTPGLKRFATAGYRRWENIYMPRPFCRLVVKATNCRKETQPRGLVAVVDLELLTDEN